MSFFSRLGLRPVPVKAEVQTFARDVDVRPTRVPNLRFSQVVGATPTPSLPDFSLASFLSYWGSGDRGVFIDHPTRFLRLGKPSLDDDGDLVFPGFECPDCRADGTCAHCKVEHFPNASEHVASLFAVLRKLPQPKSSPGVYLVHDVNMVSVWTRSGVLRLPFNAPVGTLEGSYFF